MAQSAPTIKKLSLELGGNAPFIVFEDADLDAAIEGTLASKYRNAGQTCVCSNRIYVQSKTYELFAEKLAARGKALPVGVEAQESVLIGPLIDQNEVIATANNAEFGLAAYFYTENARRVWGVTEALDYGMVGHIPGLFQIRLRLLGVLNNRAWGVKVHILASMNI